MMKKTRCRVGLMAECMLPWTLRTISRCAVLIAGLFLLSCIDFRHLSPEDPTAFIPDHSSEVTLGQMERAAVRSILGTPQSSSAYWGFDLFRADTEQILEMPPWWPIPGTSTKDKLQRYTLVAYDDHGRASAVASGLFRKPISWPRDYPIRYDFPWLHLRAGELMFSVYPRKGDGEVNLFVVPRGRDAFLQHARSSRGCIAVLACGDWGWGCGNQVSVDAGPVLMLPLRIGDAYWYSEAEEDAWLQGVGAPIIGPRLHLLDVIVALQLSDGEHDLEFSASHLGGKSSVRLSCHPGEVTYLVIRANYNESFWNPALVDWQIDQSNVMPERVVLRPMVLLYDGQWYVNTDPIE